MKIINRPPSRSPFILHLFVKFYGAIAINVSYSSEAKNTDQKSIPNLIVIECSYQYRELGRKTRCIDSGRRKQVEDIDFQDRNIMLAITERVIKITLVMSKRNDREIGCHMNCCRRRNAACLSHFVSVICAVWWSWSVIRWRRRRRRSRQRYAFHESCVAWTRLVAD